MVSCRKFVCATTCLAVLFVCAATLRAAPDTSSDKKPSVDLDGLPLPDGARAVLGSTRFRHPGYVLWLGALDDNKHLLSLASDGRIRLWEIATGREVKQFNPLEFGSPLVGVAALSPDRKTLATAGDDRTLRVWDAVTGKEQRQFPAAPLVERVHSLTFSSDGKSLASYARDGVVRLWDPATGKELKQIPTLADEIPRALGFQGAQIAFSSDGKSLTVVDDWVLRVFDVEGGKEQRWLGGHTGSIYAVTALPGGKHIVSAARDRVARIWDLSSGKTTARLPCGTGGGRRLALSPDGKTVAVAADHTVRLYEVPSGKPVGQIEMAATGDLALAFSADGKMVMAGGPDTFLSLYDVTSGREQFPSRVDRGKCTTLAFAPDGKSIVSASSDRKLIVWEAATGKAIRTFPLPVEMFDSFSTLRFAPDGKSLLSLGRDRTCRRWDIDKGEVGGEFVFTPTEFRMAALSADGRYLVSGGTDRKIRICDVEAEQEIARIELKSEPPSAVLLTPNVLALGGDGRFVTGLLNDRTLRRWHLKTGVERERFGPMNLLPAANLFGVSTDGCMAIVVFNETPILLELATGKMRQIFPVAPATQRVFSSVTSVALSPDSQTLATSYSDGALRFWDCPSGKALVVRKASANASMLTFSADGKSLAAMSVDGLATVWDVPGKDDPGRAGTGPLTADKAEALWQLLSSDDGAKAFQAVVSLADSPKETLEVVRKHLKEQTGVSEKEIAKLIAELDDDDFVIREKAMQKLIALSKAVEWAVRKALTTDPTLEAKLRLEQILKKGSGGAAYNPELAHAVRTVEVLERIGTPEAQALLEEAAKGPETARLTSEAQATLERLRKR